MAPCYALNLQSAEYDAVSRLKTRVSVWSLKSIFLLLRRRQICNHTTLLSRTSSLSLETKLLCQTLICSGAVSSTSIPSTSHRHMQRPVPFCAQYTLHKKGSFYLISTFSSRRRRSMLLQLLSLERVQFSSFRREGPFA